MTGLYVWLNVRERGREDTLNLRFPAQTPRVPCGALTIFGRSGGGADLRSYD